MRVRTATEPSSEQLPLALEWEVAPGVPAVPALPRHLRLVGSPDPADEALPDPRLWAARLARAVSEVMIGERPAAQLTRWVARDQLSCLALRASAIARHPSSRGQRPRPRTVRSVRACAVAPGIVETSAVLVGGERAQAIAIRLEAVGNRWLATAVELR